VLRRFLHARSWSGSCDGVGVRPTKKAFSPVVLAIASIAICACAHKRSAVDSPQESSAPGADTPSGEQATGPQAATSTVATAAPLLEAGPPHVQRIGRFDERPNDGPKCGWPACRVIARFDGTAVSVRLGEEAELTGPSEWDVAVDGAWKTPHLVLAPGAQTYELAKDLPAGVHTVELYRRTEGQNGVTQLLGFDFHGGTLLAPPARKQRHLEIIGDSDVSGFGYEGSLGANCASAPVWSSRFENFRGAWGERLAQKLDAELNATVYSGKGFYFNIWRPDTDTIGVLYPRSNPVDPTGVFDLQSFVPDVEVVSIGGNDYNIGQPQDFGPAPLDGVTAKARDLTATLRKAYPRAHIFLMAYAVLTDEYPPGRERRTNIETALRTVTSEHNAAGDARVYFVAPPPSVDSELTACDGHGGPEYHERIAAFMASQIAAKAGW
jgi:hypothetical protein